MRYQAFYPFHNPPSQSAMTPGPQPMQFGSPMPFPPNTGEQQNQQAMPAGTNFGQNPDMPSRADQYMQTANRFFNTAQQFAPLVQQFAPLVQNLPAMWRLYKGVQSMPDAPAAAPSETSTEAVNQPSSPRIFQPPF